MLLFGLTRAFVQLTRVCCLNRGRSKEGDQPLVFTYHEIQFESPSYVYAISHDSLDSHLGMFVHYQGPSTTKSSMPGVAFDDGHASVHRLGLPLLAAHGLQATFFITASWIDDRPDYMSWADLREVAAAGHRVQSHGWSHAWLTHCTPGQLVDELVRSRELLEDKLGAAVESISMPGGRWNDRVLAAAARAGYRRVYTSDWWALPGTTQGVQVEGRFMVRRTHTAADLRRWMAARNNRLHPLRLRTAAARGARSLVGDTVYHSLWRRLGNAGSRTTTATALHGKAGEAAERL